MKSKLVRTAITAAAAGLILSVAIVFIGGQRTAALATPGFQFNSETLARVLFGDIHVMTHSDMHKVKIQTKGPSDVYIVRNRVPPGGFSGWHTHPGPSIVAVTAGTATVYDGDDPNCVPAEYPAGTGFVDAGDGHVHMVRNEGAVDLETIAFQTLPAGADRRIDAPSPGFCPF